MQNQPRSGTAEDRGIARRQFLTTAGAVCLPATLVPSVAANSFCEPVTNTLAASKKHFKLSLAAYSYRKLLTGAQPKLSLDDFVDDCARFGLEGTELTSYYFPDRPSSEFLYSLKARAFKKGLDVSGTAIRNDFGAGDPEKLAADIAHVKRWVKYAQMMGTSVIRIFAGHHPGDVDRAKSHRQMVAAMEECCDFAGQHGVFLALENHGGPTATPAGLLKFIQDVKSPWLGINLDTGNFHTEDIYGDLEKVAPHAINVQVKVVTSGPDRKKSPTDFNRLATILTSAGYRGYVVLEYEEGGDPRSECRRYIDLMREVF